MVLWYNDTCNCGICKGKLYQMKFFSLIFYDMKRLFGHGKTAFLAILSPVPVLLLYAVFFIPILTSDNDAVIAAAIYNADENDNFAELVNLVVTPEVSKGMARIYPVKEFETGMNLVEEGKVSAYLYIPAHTYEDSMSGKRVVTEYYYSPKHSFDALTFYASLKSTLSVFGQGIRNVRLAAELAKEKGVSDEEIITLWQEGSEELIDVHLHRGRIIGKNGVFAPGSDYYLRFALGCLFAVCAYFVSFPVMYLTAIDTSETFKRRNPPEGNLPGYYLARLFSGTLLILCSFLIMYPVAGIIRKVPVRFALSVIPAMILTALVFSALAILIGSVCRNGQTSLWAGLYFGFFSVAGVALLSSNTVLPSFVSSLLQVMPLRAAVSLFSNAMFKLVQVRYKQDMLVLFAAFLIFASSGFLVYLRRGRGR